MGLFKKIGKVVKGAAGILTGGLFGGQKLPEMPEPPMPPAPPPDLGEADEAIRLREDEDARLRRRGRAATLLTGTRGAGTPTTAAKLLLGE